MANFSIPYENERDGQIEFFDAFGIPYKEDGVLIDNTDGVYNGILFEFKLSISNLNRVLFQTIKYLSKMRIKGRSIPSTILLVSLNSTTAYLYNSEEYINDIQKVYIGAASKNNKAFQAHDYVSKYNYSEELDASKLAKLIKANKKIEEQYIPIDIDEDCIVGWATRYYAEKPSAKKGDFLGDEEGTAVKVIGEIRKPRHFKYLINPYTGKTNERFKYLMDRLNDRFSKKKLGAFYTPPIYAEKATELVVKAMERIPEGNDYIILDRCAGTGSLEAALENLYDKNGDPVISHCVVSTYEYYEYKVLQERIGDQVREIIPPTEANVIYDNGLVSNADALSEEYINNPIIKQYVDDPKCTIILFENPPFVETTSIEHQKSGKGKNESAWKDSFVSTEMHKEIKGTATNDIGNAFIWSGFKYYMRQPTDSFIVFSPVKYWKAQHLIDQEFLGGFGFNRKFFHANIDACIMVALWANEPKHLETIQIHGFNYDPDNNILIDAGMLDVSRIHSMYSRVYYDKRVFEDDKIGNIVLGFDGNECPSKNRITPKLNDNIIAYMTIDTSGFDNPDIHSSLITTTLYNAHGFFLRKDNYLEKLPMFCASRYITYNRAWTERTRIMKSADGADRFFRDVRSGKLDQWLRKCLLFTCLETQSHMRSFVGSDGLYYRNELCLDITNGPTIASADINKLKVNETEERLLDQWETLITAAKKTKEYDPGLTYGVYQIFSEIDTSYKDEDGNTVYNNVEVHSALQTLKELIKPYYKEEIVPILFEYEFLK